MTIYTSEIMVGSAIVATLIGVVAYMAVQPRHRAPRHSGSDSVVHNPDWCPRQDTVSGVFELLLEQRVVQVRGTPASGKTTLMHLLHAHIVKARPNAKVHIYKDWDQKSLEEMIGDERMIEFLPGYPYFDDAERFFLFDEGQTTYWDRTLWVTFKDNIKGLTGAYAILFCSYGNEVDSKPDEPTRLRLNGARVTLGRVHQDESKSFGLLLHKPEFCDVIKRLSTLRLTDDLRDFVYNFTGGHIGAILAVTTFLRIQARDTMQKGIAYSLDDFYQNNASWDKFCQFLSEDYGIQRGTPLKPADYAQAMRALLFHGSIDPDDKSIDADIQTCLDYGYKHGFVAKDEADQYIFASPLHQQLWSWRLLPQVDYQLPYQDLLSFVKSTVAYFRPQQLDGSDRHVGSTSHRPPEAQYQEEYYRCVHRLTDGNVRISPEYAAAAGSRAGRIDFFIPSKKWGIELTRDGNKLIDHEARFADNGAYEQWLKSSDMDDYILLDFCNTKPARAHPSIRNLYHVVFSDDKTQLEIYDNELKS